MCRRVTCDKCKKPTWAGCGQHIEQCLAGVPAADRFETNKNKFFKQRTSFYLYFIQFY